MNVLCSISLKSSSRYSDHYAQVCGTPFCGTFHLCDGQRSILPPLTPEMDPLCSGQLRFCTELSRVLQLLEIVRELIERHATVSAHKAATLSSTEAVRHHLSCVFDFQLLLSLYILLEASMLTHPTQYSWYQNIVHTCFSRNGRYLAICCDSYDTLEIMDLVTGISR